MTEFLNQFLSRRGELMELFIEHMNMTTLAVFISLLIGVPLGILITRSRPAAKIVIGIANVMQSIPCIALLAFSVPFVGIGTKPAILMVITYALLPIIKNTYTGITSIDPKTIEVSMGLGLTKWKRLFRIELPIAAPFIMSGIRISAVAAVGTMTIAAFAGAGGLGWFINLGLNSQNISLVLLGAIPASLMALGIDFLLGRLEHALTPEGLRPPELIQNISKKKRRLEQAVIITLCSLLVLVPAVSAAARAMRQRRENTVTVGCSNFTESLILGYVYSELIESNTDLKVEQRFNLNGGVVCFSAMQRGDVDMFVEYTGTLLPNYLHQPIESTNPQVVYDKSAELLLRDHNVRLSAPLGFNNTYVMSVTPQVAQRHSLKTLTDLMRAAPNLRLGCTVEFIQRGDCLPMLEKTYGTAFKSTNGLDGSIRYQAVASGEVDVIDAFATDALLEKQGLVLLEDDTGFFPPYYAVNLVRQEILNQYPELESLLSKMDGIIDDATMRRMNTQVDIDGLTAKEVARQFLAKNNLLGTK